MKLFRVIIAVAFPISTKGQKGSEKGSLLALPSCAVSDSRRLLRASSAGVNDGHVVHVSSSLQIGRVEVVAALQLALTGGDGFEALTPTAGTGDVHELLILTKDHMQFIDGVFDDTDGTITDGAFEVQNAFVKSDDHITYAVQCPSVSTGNKCQVVVVGASNSQPPFGQCLMTQDHPITDACLDSDYEVSLLAIDGPHFMVAASSEDEACPNMAFHSGKGGKRRVQFSLNDVAGVVAYPVGATSLRAILAAEAQAAVLDPTIDTFDPATNTCVHYAGGIWRHLGMTESVGLAEFVIEHVVNDPNVDNLAASLGACPGKRGLCVWLAACAVGGRRLLREKVAEIVYSEFIV